MIRSLLVTLALVVVASALAVSGCNNPSCGKGTKQVQDSAGNLTCMPVDQIGPDPCTIDADAGTTVVAGKCEGLVKCGPNTKPVPQPDGTIACQGFGGGKPVCSPPANGTFCVDGTIRHWIDSSPLGTGEQVHLTLYDPQAFLLMGTSAPPLTQAGGNADIVATDGAQSGSFVFQDVNPPGTGLLAMTVQDANGGTLLAIAATGAQVAAGHIYHIDGYALPKATVAAWTAGGGFDYDNLGGYVACFYSEPTRAASFDFTAYEMLPVAGVQLMGLNGAQLLPQADARYMGPLKADRDKVQGSTVTATGPAGCAITHINGLGNFTGMGPGAMKWEAQPGGSAQHVIFITRFHPGM